MFKEMNIQEFNKTFTCEDDCRHYLYQIKWRAGFKCRKCGGKKFGKGHTTFDTRCFKCHYIESVTANTMFHKIKFPLLKAFGIIFRLISSKSGVSSIEIAQTYRINQKTVWLFLHKIRKVMGLSETKSKKRTIRKESVYLDSIVISDKESINNGLQRIRIDVLTQTQSKNKRNLFNLPFYIVRKEKCKYNCRLNKGRFMEDGKDIRLWNFKSWLTGTHHHCSRNFLQAYLNEFFFKLNHREQKNRLLHLIIQCMITMPIKL